VVASRLRRRWHLVGSRVGAAGGCDKAAKGEQEGGAQQVLALDSGLTSVSELGTRNSELGTRNSELGTRRGRLDYGGMKVTWRLGIKACSGAPGQSKKAYSFHEARCSHD